MNMSLYELDQTIKEVLDKGFAFNEDTGEVTFTEEDLNNLQTSVEEKINNIVGYIKNLELEEKTYKEISDDYKKRSDSKKAKMEQLKGYLDRYLISNSITSKEVRNGIVSYRFSKVLEVFDESKLMKYIAEHELEGRYLKTKIEISKNEIKEDVKNGVNVAGVEIVTKNNLQVR